MTPSQRALARAVELLGTLDVSVRCAVAVSDAESVRWHRRVMVIRVAAFALGAALAVAWGVGWLFMVAAAVVHQLFFNVHRVLAATQEGLVLADISLRRAAIVDRWGQGTDASLVLRTDSPQVEVTIEAALSDKGVTKAWNGHVNGADLDAFEATIRAGGGEPLRRTATD